MQQLRRMTPASSLLMRDLELETTKQMDNNSVLTNYSHGAY